jgi:hypothetical protein
MTARKVDANAYAKEFGTEALRRETDRAKPLPPLANGDGRAPLGEASPVGLVTVVPSSWTDAPPERKWLAYGRIPAGDVTLLSADGGSGKTEIAVQLSISVALGLSDWLGVCVEAGLALMVSAEEPEEDIRMRCDRICRSRGADLSVADNLHFCFPDLEAAWLVEAGWRRRRSSTR